MFRRLGVSLPLCRAESFERQSGLITIFCTTWTLAFARETKESAIISQLIEFLSRWGNLRWSFSLCNLTNTSLNSRILGRYSRVDLSHSGRNVKSGSRSKSSRRRARLLNGNMSYELILHMFDS